VPERYLQLPNRILEDVQWDQLQIPVGIAFFFYNTPLQRISAFYPSPAGATESLLPLEIWGEWVKRNPVLATIAADVEALLIRNLERSGNFEAFIVPVDACYELVGRIRRSWKGFDGGAEAWSEVNDYFSKLRRLSEHTAWGDPR
jgi:hypothetical protein